VSKRKPTPAEWDALAFAWNVSKHVKSNAIVFATKDQTLGIGAGQMSRIDSVKIAISKAQKPLTGTVVASDGFFPFRDNVDAIARTGALAIIQPGGSVKDEEVVKAADELGLSMVFTGKRHFKH
jgi:phosphoribosylaminoimidazolecarboxamide formyltransferase/IMP cyclohydrolase